ncbi:amino acid permease [Exiguobacterium antarcticum]|uniref:Amino acid permease n=1 Tax=Exiguobacterium antarcticum TaxID=132920 RepID=A0ABT6R1Q2_9BACL|nr:amino acid permease [Exiguobacterium antarcticum]AFS69334.1 GABA permease [Exiguobacterium antarcticum B7]MDI3234878.1 amino acid permease [Exiguobacterium antarcticum]
MKEHPTELRRDLKTRQLTMIAMGCAIGTGLFLGSGLAISLAGPSVLVSYAIGAFIVLLLMGCLAEMTVAHPTSGSFGTIAEQYISPYAGFLVRYSYWVANVLAIGVEVSAIAIYMKYWFPDVPGYIWIFVFAIALIYINATTVNTFATFEYWFSVIKISAILMFMILGAYLVFGSSSPDIGPQNFTNDGGFLPFGFSGLWIAVFISLFSFLGTELIAVTAGEAKDPDVAVPKALKATVFRLSTFYVITIALMLMIVPWQQAGGVDQSPFVKVMEMLSIPGAAGIMNFIILTAALSAMNSQLYASTRMMYSLSKATYAPRIFSRLNTKGVPLFALAVSTLGIFLAAVISTQSSVSYPFMMGISMFGAIFTWFMIFISHLYFRKAWERDGGRKLPVRMMGYPYLTALGAILLFALVITTWFTDFQIVLKFGVPWLLFLTIAYVFWKRNNPPQADQTNRSQSL